MVAWHIGNGNIRRLTQWSVIMMLLINHMHNSKAENNIRNRPLPFAILLSEYVLHDEECIARGKIYQSETIEWIMT